MYIINEYQLLSVASQQYLSTEGKGARLPNQTLVRILTQLQQQPKLEISAEQLSQLASEHHVDEEQLKNVLIHKLDVLKPMLSRKFPLITINSDDPRVEALLKESFDNQYHLHIASPQDLEFSKNSLVLFYRKNYSHTDFKRLYQNLPDDVFLITAGVLHHLLIIDNLYFKGSGLPTHVSNLHQLMAYLHSNVPATKNNWLLYYRELVKNNVDTFPEPTVNACQQGYIAYCLYQFAAQFTHLWKKPTPLDQINWFWHVDLTSFDVHREVAIHSPFSEYDMKLNVNHLLSKEPA